jgi:hypothetical protein
MDTKNSSPTIFGDGGGDGGGIKYSISASKVV